MKKDALKALQIEYYVDLLLRRRWFIIIPFCFAMTIGIYLSFTLPRVYKAHTLILVVPKSVPDKYVPSIVRTDLRERINTISDQIKSRTTLEEIIDRFKLFSGPAYKNMYLEDKLAYMRKRISVKVKKSGSGTDSFTISFEGSDPDKVMNVVNTLADYFINESVSLIENEIVGTSIFLDSELGDVKRQLEEHENALRSYRERYMGGLPEQLQTNLRILDRLQIQLSQKQEGLRDGKNRLAELDNKIAALKAKSAAILDESEKPVIPSQLQKLLSQLKQEKSQLAILQARYTESHPDIIRLKKSIAAIEEQITAQSNTIEPSPAPRIQTPETDPAKLELFLQRDEVKREIQTHEEDISTIQRQIRVYEKRVEDTPKREAELLSLNRNYSNIKEMYDSLLTRKLEAERAVSMEKKSKGEKFRIVDHASRPQKPVSPDIKKIFAACLIAGLGIGFGIVFALDFFDHTFRMPEDIESSLGIPVIAVFPKILTPIQKKFDQINRILTMLASLGSLFLFCVFVLLVLKGVNGTMQMLWKIERMIGI